MPTSGEKIFDPQTRALVDLAYIHLQKDPQVLGSLQLEVARQSISLLFSDWMNSMKPTWLLEDIDLFVSGGAKKIVFDNDSNQIMTDDGMEVYDLSGIDDIESIIITDMYSNTLQVPDRVEASDFNMQRSYVQEPDIPYVYWFSNKKSPKELRFAPEVAEDMIFKMMITMKPDIITSNLDKIEIPSRAQSAFTYGLAVKLAPTVIGGYELLPILEAKYQQALMDLKQRENDGNDFFISSTVFDNLGRCR